jgi:hypothetical protein
MKKWETFLNKNERITSRNHTKRIKTNLSFHRSYVLTVKSVNETNRTLCILTHTQQIYNTIFRLLTSSLMIQMNAHLYGSLSFAQVRAHLLFSLNGMLDIYIYI